MKTLKHAKFSAVKRRLEEILESMRYEERVRYLIYTCGYSSEDAEDYAGSFDSEH